MPLILWSHDFSVFTEYKKFARRAQSMEVFSHPVALKVELATLRSFISVSAGNLTQC